MDIPIFFSTSGTRSGRARRMLVLKGWSVEIASMAIHRIPRSTTQSQNSSCGPGCLRNARGRLGFSLLRTLYQSSL